MIVSLIAKQGLRALAKHWRLAAIGALGLGMAIVMWRADRISADRDRQRERAAAAEQRADNAEADLAIRNAADFERAGDDRALAILELELDDAISDLPDTEPSPLRLAYNCVRARRAGIGPAYLPAPCRPGAGGEAALSD